MPIVYCQLATQRGYIKLIDNIEVDLKLAIDDVAHIIKVLWTDINSLKLEIEALKEELKNKPREPYL